MKNHKKDIRNKEDGFTIIEVMIVLAIAGLIMLVVFLAVPALQRNSRNTQRQNDAARMASAVNECIINNNGRADECQDFLAEQLNQYYVVENDNQQLTESIGTVPTGPDELNHFFFQYEHRCNDTGTEAVDGGGTRSFTIEYQIETQQGEAPRCLGS